MAAPQIQPDVDSFTCDTQSTVVVTGFGPFGKHAVNASWEAVRLLPTIGIEKELNINLVIEEIPVSYEGVNSKVPELWHSHKPLLVIHVGVSDMAKKITLEKVAEKSGYKRQDVCGCIPVSSECCIGDLPIIHTAIDINNLSSEINSTSEVQTAVSNNAGRYLCEYIYYTSLSIDNSRSIFIHVPPLDKPYSAEQLAKGLADIVRCLVCQLQTQSTAS